MHPLNRTIRGLLIEDSPSDALIILDMLGRRRAASPGLDFSHAADLRGGLEALRRGDFDLILLDLTLPDSSGIETVSRVRGAVPDIPIVVLTGLRDEELGLQAVQQGAQDYLVKGDIDARGIQRTVRYAVERHLLEKRLRLVEQLRVEIRERRRMDKLKDEFISTLTHEIRSPLSVIAAAADYLAADLAHVMSPEQSEMAAMQRESIQRLKRIVDRILDLARLESGRAEIASRRVEASPIIEDVVGGFRLLARRRGLEIATEVRAGLPALRADPELLVQVLNNLLDNALRFARRRIVVAAEVAREYEAGPRVRVSVQDDGPGIPPDRLGDIFDKFVQVARSSTGGGYHGTGLGLAISREIVERQGGRIWADSEPGRGARFSFTVPVEVAAAPSLRTP